MKQILNQLKQISDMKKILLLLSMIFLLNGCAESLALLGTSASNGRIVQSSLNSAISYGVKKQTGKTPLEHAVAYAEKKNPEKKQKGLKRIEKDGVLFNPFSSFSILFHPF